MMIKTKNMMTLIAKIFKDIPEESEHEFEHSCHDPSHMMSTLCPQICVPKFVVISQPLKK